MANTKCTGCGKAKSDSRKYCARCRGLLDEMKESGYLTEAPRRSVFSDQRGRKCRVVAEGPHEDDYGDESAP
jgi:hypothetical protein